MGDYMREIEGHQQGRIIHEAMTEEDKKEANITWQKFIDELLEGSEE